MKYELEPKIYVACLAAYNAGHLHGEWLDATLHKNELQSAVNRILRESPIQNAEEWAIHDYEGFGDLRLAEFTGLDTICPLVSLLVEHGEAYAAFSSNVGLEHAKEEDFLNRYRGCWDSEKAFAQDLFDELYLHSVPDFIQAYINYDSFCQDLFCGDYYSSVAPGYRVFVFASY